MEDYAILVSKIREYAQETEDLSQAIHKAVDYCIAKDHLRDFLTLNRMEVEPMLLSEGTVEEYVDSMDQEIERLKETEKALKQELLDRDKELAMIQEKNAQFEKMTKEKDARIKELEAQLTAKQ